jgi:very-short-patch-repair endonuclease
MSWLKTLTLRARENRKKATPAEDRLWQLLRRKALHGLKFYRQYPIGYAIVDFYCPSKMLVIEVDGGIHDSPEQRENDKERERILCSMGLRVLRFRNEEVFKNLHEVAHRILEACKTSHEEK